MSDDGVMVSNRELFEILLGILGQPNIMSVRGNYGGWNPGPYVRAKTNDGIFVFELRKSRRFNTDHYRLILGSETPENQVIEDFDTKYSEILFNILNAPDFGNTAEHKQTFFKRIFHRSK